MLFCRRSRSSDDAQIPRIDNIAYYKDKDKDKRVRILTKESEKKKKNMEKDRGRRRKRKGRISGVAIFLID